MAKKKKMEKRKRRKRGRGMGLGIFSQSNWREFRPAMGIFPVVSVEPERWQGINSNRGSALDILLPKIYGIYRKVHIASIETSKNSLNNYYGLYSLNDYCGLFHCFREFWRTLNVFKNLLNDRKNTELFAGGQIPKLSKKIFRLWWYHHGL